MSRLSRESRLTPRKNRKKRKGKSAVVGKLLLEVIAVAAFWIMLSIAKFDGSPNQDRQDALPNRPSEFGAVISGLFSDQLDRHRLFIDR